MLNWFFVILILAVPKCFGADSFRLFPSDYSPPKDINAVAILSSPIESEAHLTLVKTIWQYLLQPSANNETAYYYRPNALSVEDIDLLSRYIEEGVGSSAEINSRLIQYFGHFKPITLPTQSIDDIYKLKYIEPYIMFALLVFVNFWLFFGIRNRFISLFLSFSSIIVFLDYKYELFSHMAERETLAQMEEPYQCRDRSTWSFNQILSSLFYSDETIRSSCTKHRHEQRLNDAPIPHGKLILKTLLSIFSLAGDTLRLFLASFIRGLSTWEVILFAGLTFVLAWSISYPLSTFLLYRMAQRPAVDHQYRADEHMVQQIAALKKIVTLNRRPTRCVRKLHRPHHRR